MNIELISKIDDMLSEDQYKRFSHSLKNEDVTSFFDNLVGDWIKEKPHSVLLIVNKSYEEIQLRIYQSLQNKKYDPRIRIIPKVTNLLIPSIYKLDVKEYFPENISFRDNERLRKKNRLTTTPEEITFQKGLESRIYLFANNLDSESSIFCFDKLDFGYDFAMFKKGN